MRQCGVRNRFAVERNATRVNLAALRARGNHVQLATVRKHDSHIVKARRTKRVIRHAGANLVETKRTQDVPGAHLPSIVVTRKASGPIFVLSVQNRSNMLLRLLRRPGEVVQICDVMAGLVAVRVVVPRKKFVKLGFELCLAAFEFDESGNILWNKERVLPRQPFRNPAVGFGRIERE